MARIRSIKPSTWDDEIVGTLSRDARLMFIATWNFADDEGLLRWSAAFIKSSVFKFDEDLSIADVEALMAEVVDAEMVYPYVGGRARQRLAFIVNFRRHQKINRPYPGQLPPPPFDSADVLAVYARRDRFTCRACHEPISEDLADARVRRIKPTGGDDPTNVAVTHEGCELPEPAARPVQEVLPDTGSVSDSLNGSVNGSRKGGAEKPATSSRGTRIPDPFVVTDGMRVWFRKNCPNLARAGVGQAETDKFVDYWTGESGKSATKSNWVNAWYFWMRKAEERAPRSRTAPGRSTTDDRVAQVEALRRRHLGTPGAQAVIEGVG